METAGVGEGRVRFLGSRCRRRHRRGLRNLKAQCRRPLSPQSRSVLWGGLFGFLHNLLLWLVFFAAAAAAEVAGWVVVLLRLELVGTIILRHITGQATTSAGVRRITHQRERASERQASKRERYTHTVGTTAAAVAWPEAGTSS